MSVTAVGRLKTFVLMSGVLSASGCTSAVPLKYEIASGNPSTDGIVLAYTNIVDRRQDRSLDEALEEDVGPSVDRIVQAELMSTGVVGRIVALEPNLQGPDLDALREQGVAVWVEPELQELRWNLPNYDELRAVMFAVSLLTGGVGALVYGGTPSSIYGHAQVKVRMVDIISGREIDKVYAGSSKDTLAKLSSDTPNTKSRLVGEALDEALEDLSPDFAAFVRGEAQASPDAAGSSQ